MDFLALCWFVCFSDDASIFDWLSCFDGSFCSFTCAFDWSFVCFDNDTSLFGCLVLEITLSTFEFVAFFFYLFSPLHRYVSIFFQLTFNTADYIYRFYAIYSFFFILSIKKWSFSLNKIIGGRSREAIAYAKH